LASAALVAVGLYEMVTDFRDDFGSNEIIVDGKEDPLTHFEV